MSHCKHWRLKRKNSRQRGPSSFEMQDADTVFTALDLKKGSVFLDIGCGHGDYSLKAAEIVGPGGIVYAIDQWPAIVEGLAAESRQQGFHNLLAMTCDVSQGLLIEKNKVDLCLLATILHSTRLDILTAGLARELHRVLKPNGRIAILECKKEEQDFGPTLERRLSPQQVDDVLSKLKFKKTAYIDLGYNYMVQYRTVNNQSTEVGIC